MTGGTPPEVSYERAAESYSGRISYYPPFFAKAAETFGLSKSSTVLDLGCGTGALALGFAPYCQSVLAVDRSPGMLAQRRETPPNVRFLQADVNDENTPLAVRANLVVIGNAIHFFDRDKLIALLDTTTAPSAPVLVCGTTISQTTPWLSEYRRLRKQYGTLPTSSDIYGKALFSGTPWSPKRMLRMTALKPFGARDLLENALSYATSREGILRNKENFERALERLLTPYYTTPKQTIVEILNWGVEYTRA